MTVSDGESRGSGRDERGRFLPGNKAGKGNPLYNRAKRYRELLDEALAEEDLRAVVRGLVKAARTGDVQAAKLVLAYTLGKPRIAPDEERASFNLPSIGSAADCVQASGEILGALADGRLSPQAGLQLASIVEMARRALETHGLEKRLKELEEAAELEPR